MNSQVRTTLNHCYFLSAWTNKIFYRRATAIIIVLGWFVYVYWIRSIPENLTGHARPDGATVIEHARYADFMQTWCLLKQARLDWKSILHPCIDNMEWGKYKRNWSIRKRTDATKCYLTLWDVRPAGQFSRFGIQSVTHDNNDKTIGGDSWRVHIRGPSSMSPSVIDHNNGTYEVLFLALEAGKYDVEIVLEYSICDGYKDPPRNWFINGETFKP